MKRKILFSCIPILLFLISVEVFFWLSGFNFQLDNLVKSRIKVNPMAQWAIPHACGNVPLPSQEYVRKAHKTVNSLGFVSTPEITKQKPYGKKRIVFFGGSSTAGNGMQIKDADTWPWQTWQKIQYTHKEYEFVNAAVFGYNSAESLCRLNTQIRAMQPDIIVVDHGWNDMYYWGLNMDIPKFVQGKKEWGFSKTVLMPPTIIPHFLDKYMGSVRIYQWFRKRTCEFTNVSEIKAVNEKIILAKKSRNFNPAGPAELLFNLKMMKVYAESMGAKFFVVKQPTLCSLKTPVAARSLCALTLHPFVGFKEHTEAFSAIYAAIDDTFAPGEVIDATEMNGNVEYLVDHVHLTVDGCTKLSEIVYKAVYKSL